MSAAAYIAVQNMAKIVQDHYDRQMSEMPDPTKDILGYCAYMDARKESVIVPDTENTSPVRLSFWKRVKNLFK